MTKYVIQYKSGVFFKEFTGIGPMFTESLTEAARFDSVEEAQATRMKHFGFVMTDIVEAP